MARRLRRAHHRRTRSLCRSRRAGKEHPDDIRTWHRWPDAPVRDRARLAPRRRAGSRRRRAAPHFEPLARGSPRALLLRRRAGPQLERDRGQDHRVAAGAGELRRPGAHVRGGERSATLPDILERLGLGGLGRSRRALRHGGRGRHRLLRFLDPGGRRAGSQPLPRLLRSGREPVVRILPVDAERVRAAGACRHQRPAPRLCQRRRRSVLPAVLGRAGVARVVRSRGAVRVRPRRHRASGTATALRARPGRQPLSRVLRRKPMAGVLQPGRAHRHHDRGIGGGDHVRRQPRRGGHAGCG